MGFVDDLKTAQGLFDEQAKGLALQRTFQQATEQAQQIRAKEKNEFKQQQAFKSLAEILGQQLATLGASPQEVATGIGSFSPPALPSAEQQITEGFAQVGAAGSDKEQRKRGAARIAQGQALQKELGNVKLNSDLELLQAKTQSEISSENSAASRQEKVLEARLKRQEDKDVLDFQSKFESNQTTKDFTKKEREANSLLQLAQDNGIVSARAVPTAAAAALQPGNLNESEQKQFRELGNFLAVQRDKVVGQAFGTLSKPTQQAFMKYAKLQAKNARLGKVKHAKDLIDRFASSKQIDPTTAFGRIFPDLTKDAQDAGLFKQVQNPSANAPQTKDELIDSVLVIGE